MKPWEIEALKRLRNAQRPPERRAEIRDWTPEPPRDAPAPKHVTVFQF